MKGHFSLFQNADGSAFFLKCDGEKGSMEFVSLSTAISYARLRCDSPGMTVMIFDTDGKETSRVALDELNEQADGTQVVENARCS